MNDTTKLAFIDELEKIGFVDSEMAEQLLKEAFFGKALRAAGKKLLPGAGGAGKAAVKKAPTGSTAMSQMKARWAAGAGRSGQATRRVAAPSAAMRPMGDGGSVGAGSFAPAMA